MGLPQSFPTAFDTTLRQDPPGNSWYFHSLWKCECFFFFFLNVYCVQGTVLDWRMRTLYDPEFPGLPRRCSQHQPFISLLSLPGERRFPPAPLPEHFLSHRQELTFVGQLRDVPTPCKVLFSSERGHCRCAQQTKSWDKRAASSPEF